MRNVALLLFALVCFAGAGYRIYTLVKPDASTQNKAAVVDETEAPTPAQQEALDQQVIAIENDFQDKDLPNIENLFQKTKSFELINYRIRAGDTPQSIAKKFFGNRDKWTDLLIYNRFEKPGRLPAGTIIKVPQQITRVQQKCIRNPFLTRAEMNRYDPCLAKQKKRKKRVKRLVPKKGGLSFAIYIENNKRVAYINGNIITEGDYIGPDRVVRITKNWIIMRSNGKDRRINLQSSISDKAVRSR